MASALVNTTQQTGGSLGTALINTIATSATAVLPGRPRELRGRAHGRIIHGYTTAFTFSAIVLAVAAVSAFALIRRGRPDMPDIVTGRGTAARPRPPFDRWTTRAGRPAPGAPARGT